MQPAADRYGIASPKRCSAALPQTGPSARPRLSTAPAAPCTRPCSSRAPRAADQARHRRVPEADAERQRNQRDRRRASTECASVAATRPTAAHTRPDDERRLVAEALHDRPDERRPGRSRRGRRSRRRNSRSAARRNRTGAPRRARTSSGRSRTRTSRRNRSPACGADPGRCIIAAMLRNGMPVPAAARCTVSGSQNHAIAVATSVIAAAAQIGAV